jgi:hypothetical protein
MSWIAEDILPALQDLPSSSTNTCTFDIRIFVTGAQADGPLDTLEIASPTDTEPPISPDVEKFDSGLESLKGSALGEVPGVSVKSGRPEIGDILRGEVEGATKGDVSVNGLSLLSLLMRDTYKTQPK